jgi:hypothetical protein
MLRSVALALAGWLVVAQALAGAETRRASLLWDGIEAFGSAKVSNAMDANVRRPAPAGKVALPAVFLHPLNADRARAEYPPLTATLAPGQRVFFLSYLGISDGFDWKDSKNPPDGVHFYVTAAGKDVYHTEIAAGGWRAVAVALGEADAAGGAFETTLTLADDAGSKGNVSYDWALFGTPVLVALDGRPLPEATAVEGASGVLVARVETAGGRVVIEGLDSAGKPLPAALATADVGAAEELASVRFDFSGDPACRQWRWRAEGGARVADAWGGSWQPALAVEHAGPTQAVTVAGEALRFRVSVRNSGMGPLLPEHGASVVCAGQRLPLGPVAAGQTTTLDFSLGPLEATPDPIAVRLEGDVANPAELQVPRPAVWPALPDLAGLASAGALRGKVECIDLSADYVVVQNALSRWLVSKAGLGALIYVWTGKEFEAAGSVAPWAEVAYADGVRRAILFPTTARVEQGAAWIEVDTVIPREAGEAAPGVSFRFRAMLWPDQPGMSVEEFIGLDPHPPVALRAFGGPALHAGDRATGASKGIAIFPGLEYLDGDERSSSERDLAPPLSERWVPHKFKVTVPMMLVETRAGGPVLGVAWWTGNYRDEGGPLPPSPPGACFASPDFLTPLDSHLMQLFLPSVPDGIPESRRLADQPFVLEGPLGLGQFLLAGQPQPDATGALLWYETLCGHREPEAPPRSFEEEMALCRHSFLVTAWDAEKQQSRHAVGWNSANVPGFATLMLMDARAVATGEVKAGLLERVNLIGAKTVREQGAAGLASSACCHTMGWEFPYHWGYLPGALEGMKSEVDDALQRQESDGLWGYYPGPEHAKLGKPGTRTMGICGRYAYLLAKYVAITGDPEARAGLDRALAGMAQFRVPRGAQGWECPILEPDVLASAYAVRAYVWTTMATGQRKWLEKAEFWARTGLPFQYLWDDGQHPGMRYASIPVFGSTFMTHSWIGLPVQWCGLVYAYSLQELQRFAPQDVWRRQIEGITVSAMWQQWPMENAELAGTYPDSFGQWFTVRNGVFLNPENIQLNLLAMKGMDPGLRAVRVTLPSGVIHATAPCDLEAVAVGTDVRLSLSYLPGEIVYLTLGGVAPAADFRAAVADTVLAQRDDLPPGSTGWTYRGNLATIVLGVACDERGKAVLTVRGLETAAPTAPRLATSWDFDSGAQGWSVGNACQVAAAAGALKLTVTGPDAYARSGLARIDAAACRRLALRVRLSAGRQLGLFWRSAASPEWNPDKEVHLEVVADNQWHEVEFDLSQQPLWSGRILQIRLDVDPVDTPAGSTLEMDWIKPL